MRTRSPKLYFAVKNVITKINLLETILEIKNRKLAEYELTSPIFYVEMNNIFHFC